MEFSARKKFAASAAVLKPVSSINIKFEKNEHGIYNSGDTINGTVELCVVKHISKTTGLKLEVTGIAKCSWTKRKAFKTVKYEGSQKFMVHVTHFFGQVDGSAIEVSVGVHTYTFSCKIPENAAASYEGVYGSIKYNVKVTLDIPYMSDFVSDRPFTVVRNENLNNFPWLGCKSECETDYSEALNCYTRMPIVISMKIKKSGFATNEELKVRIEICNQGSEKYSNSVLALDQIDTCTSHFPIMAYKKSYKLIACINTRSIKSFENTMFEETLKIPEDVHGSSISSSDVVRVGYQIRFTSKSNRKFKVQSILPVFIGHIALEVDTDSVSVYDFQSEPV